MKAREIQVRPITSRDAARVVKSLHYSGKATTNSQLHFGVFGPDGKCGGCLQFGPSMQKSNIVGLVRDTPWNGFLELNRMALADWLPRNSESRTLGVCLRLIRKTYPQIEWVVSFSDATACGDGTIYRASGFVLTAIKKNSTILEMPDGFRFADIGLRASSTALKKRVGYIEGEKTSDFKKRTGCKAAPGFQLRYIYFIHPTARERLTVPEIPFSEIQRQGAGMYLGEPRDRSTASGASAVQAGGGGATPTRSLE